MAAEASAAQKTSERGGRGLFMGNEKGRDVRSTNILAARAVSNMVRTSLGPKGMDKMIVSSNNDVVITNDGATILNKMEVLHPAAKMLVDISKAQDVEAGDGTTSVVVIAGGLMEAAQSLLDKGVHPSTISDAFLLAQRQSVEILRSIAIPCDLKNREGLLQIASTSLNSKVVSTHSDLLAPLAVDAVLRIINPDVDRSVDLNNIRLFKKLGGTIEDTELVDGLVFDTPVSHSAGGPVRIENAKIGLIQFCLSAPKTNMENTVIVDDYQSIDRILREERAYITELIKPIVKSGCNVLLIQKSILRDAVNDLSLSFLAKKKIMVIKDIERSDIEFICETLGCTPIADAKSFDAKKLGQAKLVEEQNSASGKFVKVTGVNNPGKTVSVLVRGSNRLICDEAERSLHDALCVVRCLVKERFLIPGGACPEVELAQQLAAFAEQQGGMAGYCIREYARSLEVIPYTLAENAGLNPIAIVSELRKQHAEGKRTVGINVRKVPPALYLIVAQRQGKISDMLEEQVVQPLLVTTSALNLATEVCRMLLKIDDVVAVRG